MKVGFTGTKIGMTVKQRKCLEMILDRIDPEEFHHGDCVGADAQAHIIALEHLGIPVHMHPPIKKVFCANSEGAAKIYEDKDYLVRNRDIVDATDILLACPKRKDEELRSGTWMTIRYARQQGKDIRIIYPDGNLGTYSFTIP